MNDKTFFQVITNHAISAHLELCAEFEQPYGWPTTASNEFGTLKVEHLAVGLIFAGLEGRERYIQGYKEWQESCPKCPWKSMENGIEQNTQEMLGRAAKRVQGAERKTLPVPLDKLLEADLTE